MRHSFAMIFLLGLTSTQGLADANASVRAVVRQNLNQIKYCDTEMRKTQPGAQGTIKVKFIVGPDGRVKTNEITEDTLGNPALAACVNNKVKRWRFDPPADGREFAVSYPFTFKP